MALTLEQYIERLDSRTELPWPAAPKLDAPKAKPHLASLPVKAVFYTVYGTLVSIPQGELLFELNAQAHTTLVLVTHDRELAARCARVVHMDAGRAL